MSEEENITGIDPPLTSVRMSHKSQMQSPTQYIDSNLLNTSSIIHRNVENLESRVSTCHSIYKLATDTNKMRQKEQLQKVQKIEEYLESIESRVDAIEKYIADLPENVRIETRKIIENKNVYSGIEAQITQFDEEMDERFNELESLIEENDKLNAKVYKKIKLDIQSLGVEHESGIDVEEFWSQIHEIDLKNKQMRSMAESLKDQIN